MADFKEVTTMRYWCQKVLPLVYDDSLSYYDVLNKVTKKLNDLIENNAQLPEYISNLIKEYISSGSIGEVVNEILTSFMLNVKNPPNNLTPAIGDGSTDDTEAFQGCIDYANSIGGGCVYIPNGVYLVSPLILRDNVSLFGFDRYSSKLVLKGGATTAMFTGDVLNAGLTGLTIDGNMDIQVNNTNLIDITASELILQNLILTDGYTLVNVSVNKSLQISDVVFDYAVVKHMNLSGDGLVLGSNLYLHNISTLKGENLVTLNNSNSVLSNIVSNGEAPVAFIINGNNNNISGTVDNAVTPFQDNGSNNTIINNGKTIQEKITGNKYILTGGNNIDEVVGSKTIKSDTLILDTIKPLQYKTPTKINKFFNSVPFKDKETEYKVLTEGESDLEATIDNLQIGNSDLSHQLTDEIANRKNADIEIKGLLDTETSNRVTAENEIKDLLNTETENRKQNVTEIKDLLQEEKTERITSDVELTELIKGNTTNINSVTERVSYIESQVIDVSKHGCKGDNVTDNSTVLTNLISSYPNATFYFPVGNYIIANNVIFTEKTNVIVANGAMIKPSTGKTISFYGGFDAPLSQCFGTDGNIINIPIVYVEWWGGYGDMRETYPLVKTDSTIAFKKAIYCLINSNNVYRRGYTLVLQAGIYCVSDTLKVDLNDTKMINITGQGQETQVRAVGTNFTQEAVFWLCPEVNTTLQNYSIKNIKVQNGGSNASVGIKLGIETASYQLQGLHNNIIENVSCADFKTGFYLTNARLVSINNCSVWSVGVTDSVGVKFNGVNGGFAGDSTLQDMNIVVHQTTGKGVLITSSGTNSGCAGIRVNNCVCYQTDEAFSISTSSNGYVNDIWISECQVDNVHNKTLAIRTNGGKVNDIHIVGTYATAPRLPIYIVANNVGEINYVFIDRCYFNGAGERIMFLEKTQAVNFTNNICPNSLTPTGSLMVLNNTQATIICNNNCMEWALGTLDSYVTATGGDRLIITGNFFNGASGMDADVFLISSIAHHILDNNITY